MKKILVINGPNLNMLGKRDKKQYGSFTLEELNQDIIDFVNNKYPNVSVEFFQSNYEGAIIDKIQCASTNYDAIVLNAGAYTHYSYAIRDAIECCSLPVVEVHISDISKREEFRCISVIEPVCVTQIAGHGKKSYMLAIEHLMHEK